MGEQRISDEQLNGFIAKVDAFATEPGGTIKDVSMLTVGMARDLSDARDKLRAMESRTGGAFDEEAVDARAMSLVRNWGDESSIYREGYRDGAKWQSEQPAPSTPTPEDASLLAAEHAAWSQETFGTDSERDQNGPLEHLSLEVKEAQANPSDVSEFADCYLLILDAARRAGFSYSALIAAARAKLEINKARQWQKPEKGKPVLHVKESAPTPEPAPAPPSPAITLRDQFALAYAKSGVTSDDVYAMADESMYHRDTKQLAPAP